MRSFRHPPNMFSPLTLVFAFLSLSFLISCSFAAQHYPSIKTWNGAPGTTAEIEWLATHYDWINSSVGSIDDWLALNPSIKQDIYFHWIIVGLVGDYESSENPNIYAKWYDWCAQNNRDWEDGFFHLGIQDTYIEQALNSWGEREDARIRYVLRNNEPTTPYGAQSYRDSAWDGSASLGLRSAGDCVYFGRLDRFDTVNLGFSTYAAYDWQGIWEYWNGYSWTSLSVSDGTDDCQHNGRVQFTPPTASQWKRTKVNGLPAYWGAQGVYYIRLRAVSAGSRGPVISQAQGRHYWVHNGVAGNTVPAWDPVNDTNGDGYRDANVNPSATARFKYESRLPHFWAWVHGVANISNPTFRQKMAEFTVETLNENAGTEGRHVGAFLDDMAGINLPRAARNRVIEYSGMNEDQVEDQWTADARQLVAVGHQILNDNGYLLGGNIGWEGDDQITQNLDFIQRSDASGAGGCNRPVTPGYWGNWEEDVWPATSQFQKWLNLDKPMLWEWQLSMFYRMGGYGKPVNVVNGSTSVTGVGTNWTQVVDPGSILLVPVGGRDYYAEISRVNSNTSLTLSAPWSGPSSSNATNYIMLARDKYLGMAAFLAFQDPNVSYFETWWGYYWVGSKSPWLNWIPAVSVDYGVPTGVIADGKAPRGLEGAYVYQSGTDPSYPNHTYYIYARDYTKAFVLVRPKTGGGSYFGDSAVTVTLPEAMRKVDYWGNVGALVEQVTLRNAEAAIFMKTTPSDPPAEDPPAEKPAEPEVSIQISQNYPDLAEVAPGTVITYTITCQNAGTGEALNVVVADALPPELTYIAGSLKLNGSSVNPDSVTNNIVSLTLASLPAGETAVITLQARLY